MQHRRDMRARELGLTALLPAVTFNDLRAVEDAVRGLDGVMFEGARLHVAKQAHS